MITKPRDYFDESFLLNCNHSFNPPVLTFPRSNISILNISIPEGELKVAGPVSHDCYNELGNITLNNSDTLTSMFTFSNFSLSTTRNMFTAVGCDTVGVIAGTPGGRNYTTGCVALCNQIEDVRNGSCNGVGCCQMSIQDGVRDFATSIGSLNNHTEVHSFNPCGYTFVADRSYNFSSLDLVDFQNRETVPVVLDWSVGNGTCEAAKENLTGYACQAMHNDCVNSSNGGYRCTCSEGFDGNPYLLDGCQDVNECESSNPCSDNATCENLVGSFNCICAEGHGGDGKRDGTGCSPEQDREDQTLKLAIPLGICIGLLLLVVGASWIYWVLKKRKLIKLKEKFFQQNGGMLLQQQLAQYRGSVETAKVFTAEELNKATNNYDESRIIGQGGYGTVYKGVLTDNKLVAIKKSKIGDQSQIEQFINEVIVLSQINHRNVVKLIGCCLETEVPLLVYEFITNGTVSDYIHGKAQYSSLSWEMRLKIARETASALAYLHSSTSMPIIHRDIKTTNILLDDNYTAKVADFGASRLVPLDQTQLTTLVQGTLGYLDPEYFHSSQLTEKSDVYSFGVVLAELLTGEKALSFDRPEGDRNLAMYFVSSMKDDRLLQILDNHMEANERTIQKLKVVADVAKGCLRVRGEERPTMKEVAAELEGLSKAMHPWEEDDNLQAEEAESLIKPSNPHLDEDNHGASASNTTIGFDSMKHHIIMPYDDGR
ncbi:wall-associated receptor kinase 5 [Ziziphus jujuba]|uniref:Wall-associated receptor kinase 5 n=1 Tax=Ziziphus jujuba TaxID=326968 RepID=A0ABM4A1G3_ZIZJJ|nr:wall-associated receptor kinase 5 [Ziziphus jujuba]